VEQTTAILTVGTWHICGEPGDSIEAGLQGVVIGIDLLGELGSNGEQWRIDERILVVGVGA
jgi:hypothetical protein